ncbi:MAG: bifunctional histidinol-phosphatase/imidazoleglycerol-phosphate dehydratase HisB [Saprospiraceae bacterium]|nr:bifunctional histidinol-phosphatase/imidazoleglycerol-phosphate dehydratase HisB [Saprospiraceae bacterium]
MKKVLFIDRDGILMEEPEDEQIDQLDKVQFLPGMFSYLRDIVEKLDYVLVMITNQDGLGTSSYPESNFWPFHELLLRSLRGEGIVFDEICIDRSFAKDNSPYRKPNTGMLTKYIEGQYDLKNSFVIGDRWSDMQLASNLGCGGIWLNKRETERAGNWRDSIVCDAKDWKTVFEFLIRKERKANAVRITNETQISGSINLDGSGIAEIKTGLNFLDHMLDQICKHGSMDLFLQVNGDLEVDEHHTFEDVAIVLGGLLKQALGKKAGITRYGYALPMDDCKAQVLLDFGGRPWIEWDVIFNRERIGDVPTEMFYHFFKSFSDHAQCNLNIKAEGENEHHKIEAIFKAFAKALKMAKEKSQFDYSIPSTKGSL